MAESKKKTLADEALEASNVKDGGIEDIDKKENEVETDETVENVKIFKKEDTDKDEKAKKETPKKETHKKDKPYYDESKYRVGLYRAEKFMRIIKKLTYEHQKDANGQIQKTVGTWAKTDNMLVFQKGVNKRLTREDLDLESVRRLIDSKVLIYMGE